MKFIQNIDNNILEFISIHLTSEFTNQVMSFTTRLGSLGLVWITISLILITSKKYRKDGFLLICSLSLCLLIGNLTLKPLIARIRPCDINTAINLIIERPTDFSFPSGHAMTSFASAIIIFNANKKMGIAAIVLASMIAFSRLYLYVHYPSDVIVGIIIGVTISILIIAVSNLENSKKKNKF